MRGVEKLRLRPTITLFVLLALVLFGGLPATAADPLTGSISGSVQIAPNAGTSTAYVHVVEADADRWNYAVVAVVQADAGGTFRVDGLQAGRYKLAFSEFSSSAEGQWYNNAESFATAAVVTLNEGQNLTGIAGTVAKRATIGGKITVPAGIDPGQIWASAYSSAYPEPDDLSSISGSVNADGTYKISGLPAGSYRIKFSGNGSGALEQWYKNATAFDTATDVTVTKGQDITGIDATLAKGATIAGKITAPAGVNLTHASVEAYRSDFSNYTVATASIAADGTYKIIGLSAGSYKLRTSGHNTGALEQWHNNAASFDTANDVAVTAGQDIAGINATLIKGATIAGTITAPAGVDLAYASVEAYRSDFSGDPAARASVAEDGTYKFIGLPGGSYKLKLSGDQTGALEQWHSRASSFATSSALTVTTGQDVTGVNATLVKGATISGTITAPPGVELTAGTVAVFRSDYRQSPAGTAYIASDGSYKILGLTAGSYKVQLAGYRNGTGALEQWNGAAATFDTATALTLTTGQDLADIDATLVKGASITGQVTLPPGVSASAGVYVYSAADGYSSGEWASVGQGGTYRVVGLPAGSYKVKFDGNNSGVMDQWYNNATSEDTAETITLAEGQDATGIDATMVKSASISGRITAPAGVDLSNSYVTVYSSTSASSSLGRASVDADGTYTVGGLKAGTYKIEFSGTNNGALAQWHNNAASFAAANVLTLTEGQDVTGINATLVKSASISGKVTAPVGVDLSNSYVTADSLNGAVGGFSPLGPDGSYRITGLTPGGYKVGFSGSYSGALDQWYSNAATMDTAQTLTLTAGQDLAGINATLVKAASISGKITLPAGVDLSTVYVSASKADATGPSHSGRINPDGTYTIHGLPAGTYKVKFTGYDNGTLPQWYNNAATVDGAASVTLAAGQDITGIDAALIKGATISGKITAPAGINVSNGYVTAFKADSATTAVAGTQINPDGTYSVVGLPAGSYKLQISQRDTGALDQWYDNATGFTTAAPVTVATSQTITGINVTLIKGASISGKITAPAGVNVTNGYVSAYKSDSATAQVGRAAVTADGTYSVIGLPAGSYKLKFTQSNNGALDQWFNNAASFETAAPVTVTTSQTATGVNAALIKGASISGTVTAPASMDLGSSFVSAYKADTPASPAKTAPVNADGSYTLVGLPTGSYKVQFNGNISGVVDQWYGGTTFAAATALPLTAGTDKPAVNFSPQTGGSISGTVTGPRTNYGYPVSVLDGSGNKIKDSYSRSDGTFSVVGLAAGSYKVAFNRSSGYATEEAQFYQGKPESSGIGMATSVAVQTGQTASNVSAVLTAGGAIGGTVTAKSGAPLANAFVQAYTHNGALVTRAGYTDAAGKYSIGGLTTGQYIVKVTGLSTDIGNLYAGNVTTEAAATSVSVTGGQTTATNLSYAAASAALTAPVPMVTGVAKVGSTLTATPGTWGPSPVTLTYQWKAAGVAITGATASTYKPVAATVGKTLTVTVTGTKTGYTAVSKTSTPTGTVMALNPALTAPVPKVTGVAKVGSTLTATPGAWGPAPVTLKYQWKAAGIAITGATASTYKPVPANLGKTLTVTVTGSKAGYTTAAKTSLATAAVAAGTLTAPVPKVTGVAKVGSALTVAPGIWGSAPVTLKYQWKAAGIAITGATASTYKPVAANLGKTLTVTVTGSKAGYTTAAKTSVATAPVAAGTLTAPVPALTGVTKVGSTLTATPGAWGPAPVTLKYQWKAAGVAITGATASTYKPVAANLGKTLTVTVTGSKAGYTTAAKTSVATAPVAAGTLTAPVPALTGVAKVGSTLTATPGAWGPAPVTLKYQWKAAGVAITGATASTYKPIAANLGKTLTVTVTGSKAGYTTAAKTSVATSLVVR